MVTMFLPWKERKKILLYRVTKSLICFKVLLIFALVFLPLKVRKDNNPAEKTKDTMKCFLKV